MCGVTEKLLEVAVQLSLRSPSGKSVTWKEKTSNIYGNCPPIFFKLSSRVKKVMAIQQIVNGCQSTLVFG